MSHRPLHRSLSTALCPLVLATAAIAAACSSSGDGSGDGTPDAPAGGGASGGTAGGTTGLGGSGGAAGAAATGGAAGASGKAGAGATGGSGGAAGKGAGGVAPGDVSSGFAPTAGTTPAVDRTEPCDKASEGQWRPAPANANVAQACMPNYGIWAPVACGDPMPKCTCDASKCLPGEVAKSVSGSFCICFSPCTEQKSGATCANGKRACIPIDDVTGKQVFICGA